MQSIRVPKAYRFKISGLKKLLFFKFSRYLILTSLRYLPKFSYENKIFFVILILRINCPFLCHILVDKKII